MTDKEIAYRMVELATAFLAVLFFGLLIGFILVG